MYTILRYLSLFVFCVITSINSIAYTGEIVKSLKTPGNNSTGLTYDGKYFWLADRKEDKIFCIDTKSNKIIKSIDSPGYWPMGLTWDGEALWNVDIKGGIPLSENYNATIYRISLDDGTILRTFKAPAKWARGLAWDGEYLWCVDQQKRELIQFDSEDGTTIRKIKAPSWDPRGLTWDGKYLWVSDRNDDEIYMVNPDDGTVIIIMKAPGKFTRGLAWDGDALWAVDSQVDNLFEIKVNDGVNFVKSNKYKAKVDYTYQITNFGPGKVKKADVFFAIPENRENQKINGEIRFSPNVNDIVTDQWNQKCVHFELENIAAGERRELHMVTTAELSEVHYYIFPDKVGGREEIPEDILTLYLRDNNKYQLHHPVIVDAVKKAVGNETNPYWISRNILKYIIKNMYYKMDGGWNTAPTVLARGNGSCSEYSFVYIAMCRAAGIPARYVGAVVSRDKESNMDDVFHRWVEIYLPNYGWIPVDPSGGDQDTPRNQARYFGSIGNNYLITTQSGGGSNTLGWTYNSNEALITESKTNVVYEYFAEWETIE